MNKLKSTADWDGVSKRTYKTLFGSCLNTRYLSLYCINNIFILLHCKTFFVHNILFLLWFHKLIISATLTNRETEREKRNDSVKDISHISAPETTSRDWIRRFIVGNFDLTRSVKIGPQKNFDFKSWFSSSTTYRRTRQNWLSTGRYYPMPRTQ